MDSEKQEECSGENEDMIKELLGQIFLGITALSGGVIIASGVAALLIGLNIVPRYAQITRTGNKIQLYETCIILGTIWGTLMTVYPLTLRGTVWMYGLIGLCFGIYVGSWVIALTEILDMIPITVRRIGLKKGMAAIVAATAFGKVLYSIIYFRLFS